MDSPRLLNSSRSFESDVTRVLRAVTPGLEAVFVINLTFNPPSLSGQTHAFSMDFYISDAG